MIRILTWAAVLGMASVAVAQKDEAPPAIQAPPEVEVEVAPAADSVAVPPAPAAPAPSDVQPAPVAAAAPLMASGGPDPLAAASAERDRVFAENRLGLPVTLLTVGTLAFGGFGLAAFGCYGDEPDVLKDDWFDDDDDLDGTSCETHRVGVNLGMAAIAAAALTTAIVGLVILIRRVGNRAGARRAFRQERRALRSWLDDPLTLRF